MTAEEKDQLIKRLSDSYTATQAVIEGADPDRPVHGDSGWRIRDIIGHIATWDRQVTLSLRAYREGTDYAIPDLEEGRFNEEKVAEQAVLTAEQIYTEGEEARQDFIEAVGEIPVELYPGDLLYPWGDERGTIALLVQYMIDHDEEHRQEIVIHETH